MHRQIVRTAIKSIRNLQGSSSARLGRWGLRALSVLAGLLLTSSWLTFQTSADAREALRWEAHTRDVLALTAELRLAALSTIRGERGYLLTHEESFLEPYHDGMRRIDVAMKQLELATKDNATQQERAALLEGRIDHHLGLMGTFVAYERSGQHDLAIARIRAGEGKHSLEAIMDEIDAIEATERQLLVGRTAQSENAAKRENLFEYVLGIVGGLLLGTGIIASIALRKSLAREASASRELRRIAMTDELTGLSNRREALAGIDRMIAAARRSDRPLTLAILDIDRFKLVNDSHGHPAGDEVIRKVAEAAARIMRDQDLVGRLGGEEFIIAFPDCSAEEALAACERLREAIAKTPIVLESGTALTVTISFGVARYSDAETRTNLIGRADQALYFAKKGGRNQVQLAG
jgi:diguanylate cyclase (GGDEF)-like protein